MDEFTTVKYYISVLEEFERNGFAVNVTYRSFDVVKDGETVAHCRTVDGLNSWLEAYQFCSKRE